MLTKIMKAGLFRLRIENKPIYQRVNYTVSHWFDVESIVYVVQKLSILIIHSAFSRMLLVCNHMREGRVLCHDLEPT